jgi:hypothetical protein
MHDPRSSLGGDKLGVIPQKAPPCPYLPLTPTAHWCPTQRFASMKIGIPSNKSIRVEEKLPKGTRKQDMHYTSTDLFSDQGWCGARVRKDDPNRLLGDFTFYKETKNMGRKDLTISIVISSCCVHTYV